MKRKNLMPWRHLLATGSRFDIAIGGSRYKYYLYILALFVVTALVLPFSADMLTIWSVIVTVLLLVSSYSPHKPLKIRGVRIKKQLTLTSEGRCYLSNGPSQRLTVSSRVCFLGCWLILEEDIDQRGSILIKHPNLNVSVVNNDTNKAGIFPAKHRSMFIFRDSLSPQGYARLSRIIMALKVHQL